MTAFVGHSICVSLNTSLGVGEPEVTDEGVWEDWCQAVPNDRWNVFPTNADAVATCTSFGCGLRIVPHNPASTEYAAAFLESTGPIRIADRTMALAVKPIDAPSSYAEVELERIITDGGGLGGDYRFRARITADLTVSPAQLRLRITENDSGSLITNETLDIAYDATNHRWWAFRATGTGQIALMTAGYCQDWTTRLSAVLDQDPLSSVDVGPFMESSGSGKEQGIFGPIYIFDTPEPAP